MSVAFDVGLEVAFEGRDQTQNQNQPQSQDQRRRTRVCVPHRPMFIRHRQRQRNSGAIVGVKRPDKQLQPPPRAALERMYDYRRKMPHYQKAGRAMFVTFCKGTRYPFSPQAWDAVLRHCLHDHGKRYELHAAVVMPDHVHLLLMPLRDEKGWPYGLPSILKALKGASARSINQLSGSNGQV